MALVSGFMPSHHLGHSQSSHHLAPASGSAASSSDLDEDLLALLASDTFSLQSHRDRDLDLLSSLLAASLPPNSSPPAQGQWIGSAPAPVASTSQWNGWTPSSGYYAPQGSYNAGPGAGPTPHGTPLSSAPLPLPSSPSTAQTSFFPQQPAQPSSSFSSNQYQHPNAYADWSRLASREVGGCRAPAASRERASGGRDRHGSVDGGLPSYEAAGRSAGGWGAVVHGDDDDRMMDD
ncbi:hypothetical protein RQP46_010487 [Phenoliferia psychrophenolica]